MGEDELLQNVSSVMLRFLVVSNNVLYYREPTSSHVPSPTSWMNHIIASAESGLSCSHESENRSELEIRM